MIATAIKASMKALLALAVVVSASGEAVAQGSTQSEQRRSAGGPRKQLATIVFAGLGGAVLGLSTLSFYGRPQDKLSNIAIGFAVGVIAGTSYVTYTAATRPSEFYGDRPILDPELTIASRTTIGSLDSEPISMSWSFDF